MVWIRNGCKGFSFHRVCRSESVEANVDQDRRDIYGSVEGGPPEEAFV